MKQESSCLSRVTLLARLVLAVAVLSLPATVHAQTNGSPSFIYGQIVMDDDLPPPLMSVSVVLRCGMQVVQAIQPDAKGNFEFVLGAGTRANMDMSAANDNAPREIGRVNSRSGDRNSGFDFFNCQVDVSAAGYRPISRAILPDAAVVGVIETGTFLLTPIAPMQVGTVSVTSLQVPKNAQKEFEKGEKDAHSNRLVSAIQHLEKAVTEYDKYAAAWNELGRIYSFSQQLEKAGAAFARAITADPQYIPPYVGLAALQLKDGELQSAAETAGEALELDPDAVVASFIAATANYRLNRLDAAEKSARDAEKRPHQNVPQLHILLAQIDLRKHNDLDAAAEMRAYLRESPQGEFAAEAKSGIEQIEKSNANVGPTGREVSTAP